MPSKAEVVVTLNTDTTVGRGVVAADGSWSVDIHAQAQGTGNNLTISIGSSSRTLVDVAFGFVILCGGQR